MKPYLCFCIIILYGCIPTPIDLAYSNNVDEFVKQLKDGECDSYKELPKFDPNDIPALLGYADDFQEISCFPVSLVSSYLPYRYVLGECLLCTIELIKQKTGEDNWNYSLWVPMLVKDEYGSDPESGMLNNVELLEVYNLYYDWWVENSKDKEFDEFRDIDVLKDSGYHWL